MRAGGPKSGLPLWRGRPSFWRPPSRRLPGEPNSAEDSSARFSPRRDGYAEACPLLGSSSSRSLALLSAACGPDGDLSGARTASVGAQPTPMPQGSEPKPVPATKYDFDRSAACLSRSAGLVVRVVEGRPLGGNEGTLRVDHDIFETQVAFAQNDAEAQAIVDQAVEVAEAVGASDARAYTRRWQNVAASWGAARPTAKAVGVLRAASSPWGDRTPTVTRRSSHCGLASGSTTASIGQPPSSQVSTRQPQAHRALAPERESPSDLSVAKVAKLARDASAAVPPFEASNLLLLRRLASFAALRAARPIGLAASSAASAGAGADSTTTNGASAPRQPSRSSASRNGSGSRSRATPRSW
jgi:hypothetical protein